MTDVDPLTILSLCSGGGGLDLGVELATGRTARSICFVEWDAFACGYLATSMAEGTLAEAPIWSDLRTFDGKPWCGTVDILTAGYPCQPFSHAGSRGGADDPRHLWPEVHRIIEEVRPPIVFLENVAGHVGLGLGSVLRDLRGSGYRATTTLIRASDVGASHQRERLFILGSLESGDGSRTDAHSTTDASGQGRGTVGKPGGFVEDSPRDELHHGGRGRGVREGGGTLADRDSGRRVGGRLEEHPGFESQPRGELDGHGANGGQQGKGVGDPDRGRHEQRDGGTALQEPVAGRFPLFPPGPGDRDAWARVLAIDPGLAPAVADTSGTDGRGRGKRIGGGQRQPETDEATRGGSAALEPKVRGVADGVARSRRHLLRLYGNGVLPLQAAYAFSLLAARLLLTEGNQ